jgi:glycolate oxidase
MRLPLPDPEIVARRSLIVTGLKAVLPGGCVIADEDGLSPYESDALSMYRQRPLAVVLPENVDQVAQVLRHCAAEGIKIVPRGAGTSLSGGALPLTDGIVLGLAKLNRIKEIDLANRCIVAEPGVTNLALSQAVAAQGFYYAPDPSSQIACTIGGNVAENAGGVHCLKYGLTTHNLLGLECVLMSGEVVRLGGKHLDSGGLDLLGLLTGSEGLLGIVTEVTVRILPKPPFAQAALIGFARIADAGRCVSAIISSGIIPAGLELMDANAIRAVEAFCAPGYPKDAAAMLLVELDGSHEDVASALEQLLSLARAAGAISHSVSRSERERLQLWAGRKAAFPAMGRLAPDMLCMDGTIPRREMARVLDEMEALGRRFGLGFANVFHAGDGNLHPLILFDAMQPGELERAEEFGAEILKLCVSVGGVLTGEHGVGVEKRDLMGLQFTETELDQQQRIKCAFDPQGRLNPGKMFPELHACAELSKVHVHRGQFRFPDLPRL